MKCILSIIELIKIGKSYGAKGKWQPDELAAESLWNSRLGFLCPPVKRKFPFGKYFVNRDVMNMWIFSLWPLEIRNRNGEVVSKTKFG